MDVHNFLRKMNITLYFERLYNSFCWVLKLCLKRIVLESSDKERSIFASDYDEWLVSLDECSQDRYTIWDEKRSKAQWSSFIERGWQNCSDKQKGIKLSDFLAIGIWKKMQYVVYVHSPYSLQKTHISTKNH